MFNTVEFLISFVIPVGFQFSSLIFGFIRNRNKKKYRIGGGGNQSLRNFRSENLMSSEIDDNDISFNSHSGVFSSFGRE